MINLRRKISVMAHARDDMVRINLMLPAAERDVFERWCRYGDGQRMSMTAAARELFRLAAAGKVPLDRTRANRLVRSPPEKKAGK